MMESLQCSRWRVVHEELCQKHAFVANDAILQRLLLFCLSVIERRRTSWTFLQLDLDVTQSLQLVSCCDLALF